jgi:hypothetical protein
MEATQARSSLHFSQPPARRLNPGPTRRWGRPANRQNPNPQPPARRLTQGPLGPWFEDGCNRELAAIPSCDRLRGGSHVGPGMEETQSCSSLHFSQPPARRLNPGPTRRWGRPANRQNPNPQPPARRLTQGPLGPWFEDGCNRELAVIPSCDRLRGGSHGTDAIHNGDAGASPQTQAAVHRAAVRWRASAGELSFMRRGGLALAVSAVLSLGSLGLLVMPGPNLGIDFTGGVQMVLRLDAPVPLSELRAAITAQVPGDASLNGCFQKTFKNGGF